MTFFMKGISADADIPFFTGISSLARGAARSSLFPPPVSSPTSSAPSSNSVRNLQVPRLIRREERAATRPGATGVRNTPENAPLNAGISSLARGAYTGARNAPVYAPRPHLLLPVTHYRSRPSPSSPILRIGTDLCGQDARVPRARCCAQEKGAMFRIWATRVRARCPYLSLPRAAPPSSTPSSDSVKILQPVPRSIRREERAATRPA